MVEKHINERTKNNMTSGHGGRIKFTLLVLLAFFPILLAGVMYFVFPGWIPSATTNEGELITPPIQSIRVNDKLIQNEKWVLIQPSGPECNEACERILYLSRQVVAGLGKDAGRVERVLLAPEGRSTAFMEMLARSHPDVRVIIQQVELQPLRSRITTEPTLEPTLFLMDPKGNIMMFYTLEKAGKPMLNDLKHLLRLSNIG